MRRTVLVLALSLAGCTGTVGPGPASDPASAATSEPSSGGDNASPILLRMTAPAGARYATHTTARTESAGAVVLTDSRGRLDVVSRGPDGSLELETRIDTLALTDERGEPVAGGGAYDLTGVVLRRRVDGRGAPIGRVSAEGATEANAQFAETMRQMIEQSITRLPEQPVRVGDTWRDQMTMVVPIQGLPMELVCTVDSTFTGVETATGGGRVADVRFESACHGHLEVPVGERSVPVDIDTLARGQQSVALADGISGAVITDSETTTRIDDHRDVTESVMRQRIVVQTTPR